MKRNLYAEIDRKVFTVLDAKAKPRTCSCGRLFACVPKDAHFFEDDTLSGWYWECACRSTLFAPASVTLGDSMKPFLDGRLYLNESNRLEHVCEIEDDIEYTDYWTSGEGIEIRVGGSWMRGRIEYSHDHGCYFFISRDNPLDMLLNLVGVLARRPPQGAR